MNFLFLCTSLNRTNRSSKKIIVCKRTTKLIVFLRNETIRISIFISDCGTEKYEVAKFLLKDNRIVTLEQL